MFSTTPYIYVRAIEAKDIDLIYRLENDAALWLVGATNVPYSRYVIENYIEHTTSNIFADGETRLMIENEQGEVVGIADLTNLDPRHARCELGIAIVEAYRRHGYAQATINWIIDYCKNILNLHQLYAYVDSTNEASCALFKELGFSDETILHDWFCQANEYHDAILFQYFLEKS